MRVPLRILSIAALLTVCLLASIYTQPAAGQGQASPQEQIRSLTVQLAECNAEYRELDRESKAELLAYQRQATATVNELRAIIGQAREQFVAIIEAAGDAELPPELAEQLDAAKALIQYQEPEPEPDSDEEGDSQ